MSTHSASVIPPRRRPRRWLLWLTVSSFALVAAIPIWKWRQARQKLEARIAVLRAGGEPVSWADLSSAPVPDDQNAAIFITRAAAAAAITSDQQRRIDALLEQSAAATPEAIAAAQPIIAARPALLRELAAAQACPAIRWDVRHAQPAVQTLYPHLNQCRALTDLVNAAALLEHARGNDARAIEHLRTVLFLGRAAERDGPLVARLVGIGIQDSAAAHAREMSLSLRIDSPAAAADQAAPASRRQVRALIDELLDESARRAAIIRAWQGERASVLASNLFLASQKFLTRPLFDRAAITMMADCDAARAACTAASYPAAAPLLPAPDPNASHLDAAALLREIMLPSYQRSAVTEFRGLTHRRVAATALALRLYAQDHEGRLPESLEPLVPRYLPQLPADPFAADGRPLAWRLSPAPLLYSVAENGANDGGQIQRDRDGRLIHWNRAADGVFPLTSPAPGLHAQ